MEKRRKCNEVKNNVERWKEERNGKKRKRWNEKRKLKERGETQKKGYKSVEVD